MQLAVEWKIRTLDVLCENLDSKRIPITKSSRNSGDIPYYGASGIVDYVADHIFNEDLLLVSEDGANLLARTYPIAFSITGKTWVNNHAHVLRFAEESTQRFIEYYLNSISLEPYISGMAQPKLNQKALNSIPIPVPPLPEQKRIVSIVDEAFEAIDIAIDNTKQNLTNARELFDSYLNTIFIQKGDGWEDRNLGTLINVLTDYHANGSYEKLKQNVTLLDEDSYAYMVRSTDFENDFTNSLKYIDQHAYEFLSKSKVFADDIIISKIGNAGKVYLMPKIDRPCSLAMNLFLLRTDKEKIRSDYLYFFLESQFGKIQIAERLNGTATKTIRKDAVRSINIFVAPLIQQRDIVEKLDLIIFEAQRLEAIYQQKLTALNELKQSILHKAFTGELTADKADL